MVPSVDCFLYLMVYWLRRAMSFWSRYVLLASINFSFTLVLPYYFCSSPKKDCWKVNPANYSMSDRYLFPNVLKSNFMSISSLPRSVSMI